MITYSTKFWFYIIIFFMISIGLMIYGITKLIKINTFEKRQSMNYYKEFPSTFIKYEKTKVFFYILRDRYGRIYYPVFHYKYGMDECILRSKYAVKYSTYEAGQKVNLYQDPKTEVIFENPVNGKRDAYIFIINGIIILAFALFNIYLFL